MPRTDMERRRTYHQEYRSRPENVERLRAKAAAKRIRNPESHAARRKRYALKLKTEAIEAYGGVCGCCGERELAFLTLGHVDDDGATHRVETGGAGARTYKWLRDRDWPAGIVEVQCFNCNVGRHINGGVCPHQENK